MDAKVARVEAKIDGVEKRVEAKIDGVEKTLTTRLDGIEKRLDGTERNIQHLTYPYRQV